MFGRECASLGRRHENDRENWRIYSWETGKTSRSVCHFAQHRKYGNDHVGDRVRNSQHLRPAVTSNLKRARKPENFYTSVTSIPTSRCHPRLSGQNEKHAAELIPLREVS